ncbi:MAG: class I SAM-dependent methyltransferase [Bacillota bacterium]|nr:class I SAM-dependent methyltransferase [Bacillota bacterium]
MKTALKNSYEKLAVFYDLLMQGIDYEAWVSYVEKIVTKHQGHVDSVLDLACGTGNSTLPWATRGYHTFGIDLSAAMLKKARQKAKEKRLEITFLQQDIREFQLKEPVDLVVCFQDGLNYILESEGLRQAFQAVSNNLKGKGYFIFDLNYLPQIVPKNEQVQVSVIEEDAFTLIWQTNFLEKENLWEIEVTGFVKTRGNYYDKFHEKHRERIYEPPEVWTCLAERGFTILGTYQAFTFDLPHPQTPRTVYVAQKI